MTKEPKTEPAQEEQVEAPAKKVKAAEKPAPAPAPASAGGQRLKGRWV